MAAAAVVVLIGVLYWNYGRAEPEAPGTAKARASTKSAESVPRIDLARLERKRAESQAGERDIFLFGVSRDQAIGGPNGSSGGEGPNPAPTAIPTPTPEPTPTPLPHLELKFVATADNGRGCKAVVLQTERNERLTACAGGLIANRYRVARIGLESVDLEDTLGGGSRRLPLKGAP